MFRRFARKTLRYLADFEQIKGVLSHAGLPVCLGNYRIGAKGQTFHGYGTFLRGDG